VGIGGARTSLVKRATQAVGLAFVSGALVVTATVPAQAGDDYPWAWQGQCPIVPQEPIEEPVPTPTPTLTPGGPGKPAQTTVPTPPPPPPPPVHDPISGHLYDPRGPRPQCARHVWAINGSIGDSWGFALRNCTSFVAWRLTRTNGLTGFANDDRGVHWGNAENWDEAARALGYRVDEVPAIGAVAQTDAGRVGHVAWVVDIGPGTATIEEYNHAIPGGYGVRTVPVGEFRYLHLEDLEPSPYVGSDRPLVSVPDGKGESWTARVDRSGTLRVANTGRRARVVGAPGAFSTTAAPAIALDAQERPWVAATTRAGRVLVGAPDRRQRWRLRDVAASAPTASPALFLHRGRLLVAATGPGGTLVERRLVRAGRWTHARRVGAPGSWAEHVAPVVGSDSRGRTWLVATTRAGRTYAQRSTRRGWTRLADLAGPVASRTSTASLTLDDRTLHLHQVADDGTLTVRSLRGDHWSKSVPLEGSWSVYSSPAVREVAGALQVAAVTPSGRVVVRPALPGQRSPLGTFVAGTSAVTDSPGLLTKRNSGVFVVAERAGGSVDRLLTRPATAVTKRHGPSRAGFTP